MTLLLRCAIIEKHNLFELGGGGVNFFVWVVLILIALHIFGRGSHSPKNSKLDYSAIVAGLAVGLFVSLFRGANKPYKN